jgi:hypothetical protein
MKEYGEAEHRRRREKRWTKVRGVNAGNPKEPSPWETNACQNGKSLRSRARRGQLHYLQSFRSLIVFLKLRSWASYSGSAVRSEPPRDPKAYSTERRLMSFSDLGRKLAISLIDLSQ